MSAPTSLDKLIEANDGIDKRMKEISVFINSMHEAMDQVQDSINEIVPISKTVQQVALNIKLLAFNAAIEAAHAGSAGVAFSVVADEVRQLAESSSHAASETNTRISSSKDKITKAINLSEKIREDFGEIFIDIEQLQQSIVMNLQAMKDGMAATSVKTPAKLAFDPETMSTGESSIDDQHKTLIEMINKLDEACKHGKGKEEINEILNFMGDYAARHFKHEENIMQEKRCPKAEENIIAHQKLFNKYTEWRKKYDESGSSLSMVAELYDFLQKWIVGHICGIDTCLKDCQSHPKIHQTYARENSPVTAA